MKILAKKFKTLGNERRLHIIKLLLKYKKLSVGDIADKINLSFRSTSRHLKVLEASDFVTWKHVGLNMYYFLSPKVSKEILDAVKKLI